MIHPESFSQQEQRDDLSRREELATKFMNPTGVFEQCRIAQNFEELCEAAFLHGRVTRPVAEWMDQQFSSRYLKRPSTLLSGDTTEDKSCGERSAYNSGISSTASILPKM